MIEQTQTKPQESLNIVIVGHVDHGKSTLVGRLYADTGSLPEGKLEKVQAICRQQGKEFEYAFLFDAFLEEQEQGITIDTARTFFIWNGRQYIIIDAPGHKEFLKNMISGAARAEAALLLIDALEGVKEQSKKHGYLLSLLGVKQFAVVVNKMDWPAWASLGGGSTLNPSIDCTTAVLLEGEKTNWSPTLTRPAVMRPTRIRRASNL